MSPAQSKAVGVYVHWPYCARICPYCDFNVVRERGREAEKQALVDAIIQDLAANAAFVGQRPLASIFFGGGTPSLMEPSAIARIVETARGLWKPEADLEVTLEANPTDAEASRFADIAAAGVNRLSLGIQSVDDRALRFLGRNHDARSAQRAIAIAQSAFSRLSLDLIYALPGQTEEAWRDELCAMAATGCEHISAYQLSIEPGAAFHRAVRRGAFAPVGDDAAADLYAVTQDVLSSKGFEAYEVSNHARGSAARTRHNLLYWNGGDYVGVGPGAHGRLTVAGERWSTLALDRIGDYITSVRETGTGSRRENLAPREAAVERVVMGLRTSDGIALGELEGFKVGPRVLDELAAFLDVRDGRLKANAAGRLVLDRVTAELVAATS